jgi:hypothetical protein
MASWIYLFSKFTPESLLFEALAIFLLICTYTAFWILRKYKYGSLAEAIPASVVKDGLNQLIGDAEALRAQLFGILANAGGTDGAHPASLAGVKNLDPALLATLTAQRSAASPAAADPELQSKLVAFEAKMAEQTRLLETIQSEKTRLELDLLQAKAASPAAGGVFPDADKLKDKVAALEARLAEYSVIEDDLANLKRLQQENAQLKSALANKPEAAALASTAAEPSSSAPTGTPTVPNETGNASTAAALSPEAALANATATTLEAEFNAAASSAAPARTPAAPSANTTAAAKPNAAAQSSTEPTPNFETLVDSVEKSLQPADSAVDLLKTEKAGTPPSPDKSATANIAPGKPNIEKTDEDLISEFEKMLNS